MEKVNPNAVALSMGITTGIIYLICLILETVLPLEILIKIGSVMFHSMDVSNVLVKNTTLFGGIIGLIIWFIIASGAGYLFAVIYNRIKVDYRKRH